MDIRDLRRDYIQGGLRRHDLLDDPIDQFRIWLKQACDAEVLEPNAMALATADADGRPTQRTVLLKQFDDEGFVFFTNLGSKKAKQIGVNPHVSLLFPWLALERQVIVTGTAEKISKAATLKYFVTRPLESQLGAWASTQSGVISGRKALLMKLAEIKDKFKNGKVPLPSFWGGFRIAPATVEFWQGGTARLHDRFLYSRRDNRSWEIDRLAP